MANPPDVSACLEVFDEVIQHGQARAFNGDWYSLWRRLDQLSRRVTEAEVERVKPAPIWAHRLERDIWIRLLTEELLPSVLADLVTVLSKQRSPGETDPGVWVVLDRDTSEREREHHDRLASSAHVAIYTALKRHAVKPSRARVLEGLRALEDLHADTLRSDALFDVELLVTEGRKLVAALNTMLPPMARRVLRFGAEVLFKQELEEKGLIEPGESTPFGITTSRMWASGCLSGKSSHTRATKPLPSAFGSHPISKASTRACARGRQLSL
jgi:hypothetical protein